MAITRSWTLPAFEGCLYGPATGWCGLHGQLLVRFALIIEVHPRQTARRRTTDAGNAAGPDRSVPNADCGAECGPGRPGFVRKRCGAVLCCNGGPRHCARCTGGNRGAVAETRDVARGDRSSRTTVLMRYLPYSPLAGTMKPVSRRRSRPSAGVSSTPGCSIALIAPPQW
jgi:hypothetical protein